MVYWLDEKFATTECVSRILSLDGVASFSELTTVSITPDHACWLWEDEFINSLLLPYVSA